MKLSQQENQEDGSNSVLRHYAPREMISPLSDTAPSIGIEYWVVLNRRKSNDKIVLRSKSNELYVDGLHPLLGSLNGQNQGELTARILRDLQLSMVAKHIIVHIDASKAEKTIRTGLFSSPEKDSRKMLY